MPPSSELPPWLRRRGDTQRAGKRRAAATATFALLLFGAGAGAGFLFARRDVAVVTPPAPAPVCPPAVVCPPSPGGTATAHVRTASAAKRIKPAPAALTPLPERAPLDEGARTQALRAFAEKKAPELRDCVSEPDRGPPLKLGAAFRWRGRLRADFGRGRVTKRRQALLREPIEAMAFPRRAAARRGETPRELRPLAAHALERLNRPRVRSGGPARCGGIAPDPYTPTSTAT